MTDTRTCYYPDGTEAKNLVPCTAKTTTACCGVNNICLSNGYCLDVNQPFSLSRGGCTAQDWGKGCPGRCRAINSSAGSAIVNLKTVNGISTYCCGTPVANGSDTICRDDTDSFQLADAQVLTGRAALANLVPPDSVSNSSNSSIAAPTPSNSHDTTIGVGLGVPLGVIAIGSILWALWERRRANKLSRAMMSSSVPIQEGLVRSPQSHVMSERSSVPTELDSHRQIPELMPREHM